MGNMKKKVMMQGKMRMGEVARKREEKERTRKRRKVGEMIGIITVHQDLPQLADTFLVHLLGYRRVLERGRERIGPN